MLGNVEMFPHKNLTLLASTTTIDKHALRLGASYIFLAFFAILLYGILESMLGFLMKRSPKKVAKVQGPRIPDPLPNLWSVLLRLIQHPIECLIELECFSRSYPLRLRLPFRDLFIIQGPQNVKAVLENRHLSPFFLNGRALSIFGLSRSGYVAYSRDNSGAGVTPHAGSVIEKRNRLDHQNHVWFHQYLMGSGFEPLFERYWESLGKCLRDIQSEMDDGQIAGDDLMRLFKQSLIGPAIIDAVVGATLLKRHPRFLEHIWEVHDNIWWLASGLPRWFAPKPNASLRQCLTMMKMWHVWMTENWDPSAINTLENVDDSLWGSKFVRERHLFYASVDGITKDDLASHDVALIWAAIHNTVLSMFWLVLDVFLNPDILQNIRMEAKACLLSYDSNGNPVFDIERLNCQPYMQASYAETLRLRTHGVILRHNQHDLTLNSWFIPKRSLMAVPSSIAHMNMTVWSNEERGSKPTSEFWPARFFAPHRKETSSKFCMSNTDGSWIPFGAGIGSCPGRRFVKREMITTLATIAIMYDIEVDANEEKLRISSARFGFGAVEPGDKISYCLKIRR